MCKLPHREAFLKPLFVKQLDLVILFVTSICNARCRTCFYWLELNKKGDMSFDELRRLSESMPQFSDLWISGGEPFLRKDLAEIIHLFYTNNKIRDVRIPTNGLPTARTLTIVRSILDSCPDIQLEVDISLDGFKEVHDRIRGVPGNYDSALVTLTELSKLKESYPNLELFINSVITTENENQIVELGRSFKERPQLDGHYFQIIRGDPMDPKLQTVSPERLDELYHQAIQINDEYLSTSRKRNSRATISGWISRAYWKAGYRFSYETQYKNYVNKTNWKMPCTAGRTSIVIDYNADVRVCELRKPIGNLRKYDMDFQKFWISSERKNEVRSVGVDKCFCTHICFMYDSMRHSKRVMLWELPKTYLKSFFENKLKMASVAAKSAKPLVS
jgi:MoaA/NifB/PqqE/SkfB family radical SAM enzyme